MKIVVANVIFGSVLTLTNSFTFGLRTGTWMSTSSVPIVPASSGDKRIAFKFENTSSKSSATEPFASANFDGCAGAADSSVMAGGASFVARRLGDCLLVMIVLLLMFSNSIECSQNTGKLSRVDDANGDRNLAGGDCSEGA